MANVYIDLDLASGSNDGSDWANAYQTLADFVAGGVTVGDDVWIKGSETTGSAVSFNFGNDAQNPTKLIGVKSATTNEPPQASDVIDGWRTGETRTIANRAYKDGDAPTLTVNALLAFRGTLYCYGIIFISSSVVRLGATDGGHQTFEECLFELTGLNDVGVFSANMIVDLLNCGFETNNSSANMNPGSSVNEPQNIIGLEYIGTVASGYFSLCKNFHFYGCDFDDMGSNPLFYTGTPGSGGGNKVINSRINSSAVIISGAIGDIPTHIELYQCSSTTGKSSGTLINYELQTWTGSIVEETTAVRTGGANDGSSNWSLAFTPVANGTRDNYLGIVGPWMAFKITEDDTQVDVYIANSGAADYNDDDVWLEVMFPSGDGTAQYDMNTTQMDLLDTPAAVTDDTDSTWGSGGNNPQTLSATVDPAYTGRAYCRVVFAKNFSSSPETLYVDPLPVVS